MGQLAADVEFHTRNFREGAFVNGTFGWPDIATLNLPSTGPAYPFATAWGTAADQAGRK